MKIGVLGTGAIAECVCPTMAKLDELECYGIASRSLEKAESFRKAYGFQKAYGSYEELLEDDEVELIYVAVPHSHHYECMKMCIEHGKPVICEKAFTVNAQQAKEIYALAQEKKVFATEAMWTRYMPSRTKLQEVLQSGTIGEIRALTANLAYNVAHRQRLHDPALAGGALLDVGVYGINFALMHFGKEISRVESSVQMLPSGVDEMETISIFYKDGKMANITAGITSRSDRQGIFYGSHGYIVVNNINNPQSISVYDDKDCLLSRWEAPKQISGYEYEFLECVKAIRNGRWESWSIPLEESVFMMEIMDEIRRQWGLVYPQEK